MSETTQNERDELRKAALEELEDEEHWSYRHVIAACNDADNYARLEQRVRELADEMDREGRRYCGSQVRALLNED